MAFSHFFAIFLKTKVFEYFEQKKALIAYMFWKVPSVKEVPRSILKSPISEHPLTDNMLKDPKHCLNLHHSTFIIFFHHSRRF